MKLIDADKLKEMFNNLTSNTSTVYVPVISLLIDAQPIVDATEVVHCPECKWYDGVCNLHGRGDMVSRKGFCYHAERREE